MKIPPTGDNGLAARLVRFSAYTNMDLQEVCKCHIAGMDEDGYICPSGKWLMILPWDPYDV